MKNVFLLSALLATSALAAEPAANPADKPDTATQLFNTFVELRNSIGLGQHSDPRFYTREWLERAIRDALSAQRQPERPGLNWVQDSLLTSLAIGLTDDRIYSYRVLNETPDRADLEMHVTGCNQPSTQTLTFVIEDGAWRITGANFDSTTKAKKWYSPDLSPLIEFAHIEPRDRSRYFNEGILGQSLDLHVKPDKPCGETPGSSALTSGAPS